MPSTIDVPCPHCGSLNRLPQARLGDCPGCGRCHGPLFEGVPMTLEGERFQAVVLRGDLPVLVDFWAPWCGPCVAFAPVFADAARTMEPLVRLAKVDTEAEPALASRFAVRSIPTLALFRGGREIARQCGAMSASGLRRWVQVHLDA